MSPQAARYTFLGYSDQHKGFQCYDPKERRLRTSRKVVFLEHVQFHSSSPSTNNIQISYLPQFKTHDLPPAITQVYTRRPKQPPPTASALNTLTMRVPEDRETTTEGK